MPHVDEGTLHALLDGALRAESPDRADRVEAHLAGCEDCRARLEAAGDVRDRASAILEEAAPLATGAADGIDPDFAEVLARAGARVDGPGSAEDPDGAPAGLRRQLTWTRRLGWAASVVLALGTGYLVRDLAGPGGSNAPTGPAATGEAAAERASAPEPGAGARKRTAATGQAPAGAAAEPAGADPGGAAERGEDLASARDVAAGETADVAAEEADEREDTPRPSPAPALAAPEPSPTPPEPSPEARLEVTAAAPPEREALERMTADSIVATEQARLEYARRTGLEDRAVAGWPATGALVEQAQRLLPAPDQRRWSAVTVAAAGEALGGPVYRLPGAELVETYAERGDVVRVMTLQRLQTGIVVRAVQWRGGEAPGGSGEEKAVAAPQPLADASRAAAPARALPDLEQVRVVRGPYVLELSGALPAALLEVLGETAEPAPGSGGG